MILRDGDERLILNMRHDTSSYFNKPKKESINMIYIYNVSHKDYLEDLFANEKPTNHQSGNPTLSSYTDLTLLEVINPLSGNPTPISEPVTKSYSSLTITSFEESKLIWEEFEAYLASDSFPLDSVDEGNLADPNNNLVDTIPEMFTDKHTLDYSSPPLYDDVDDDLVELESSDFLPSPECDSVFYEDFSEVDALPSTNNEDKKTTNASLILEDFNPPLYELPFHKEVPGSETLLSFSSENEEKVFNPGILTSKGVHTSLLQKLSHRGPKAFKVIKIFESPMEIFPCSYREDIRILDVPCLHFYPP
ncbi:hypothetical protein Tco_1307342 [Tanacetum coccineum]